MSVCCHGGAVLLVSYVKPFAVKQSCSFGVGRNRSAPKRECLRRLRAYEQHSTDSAQQIIGRCLQCDKGCLLISNSATSKSQHLYVLVS